MGRTKMHLLYIQEEKWISVRPYEAHQKHAHKRKPSMHRMWKSVHVSHVYAVSSAKTAWHPRQREVV